MEQFMKLRYVNVLGHKTSNTSLLQPHHYYEGGKYYKAMMEFMRKEEHRSRSEQQ